LYCFSPSKAWFSLGTQAKAQAQAQVRAQAQVQAQAQAQAQSKRTHKPAEAIGMTQVKKKFDANTSTGKIIRTFRTI